MVGMLERLGEKDRLGGGVVDPASLGVAVAAVAVAAVARREDALVAQEAAREGVKGQEAT